VKAAELFDLRGAVAVTTGSSSGIGQAIALTLADAGARTVIVGRDAAAVDDVVRVHGQGRELLGLTCDVTDEPQVIDLFERVERDMGTPTVLVNNAGSTPKHRLVDTTVDQWDAIQAVNLRGTFLCTREAARRMESAGVGGRIINISSVSSLHPSVEGNAAYAAAKGGVNSFTRAAALDLLAAGVTVNAVLPGAVRTPPTGRRLPSTLTPAGPITAPGRMPLGLAAPEDITGIVLLLAAPAGRYITGQTFVVDGGFLVT
jgi:NAD(P)-dependent dehydrogenase (short-subunit alcohol dehydrogenase family)